jgi:hypothetical protein
VRPILALAAGILLLTGCTSAPEARIASAGDAAPAASDPAEPAPSSTADVEEQRLAFAACMRDNGVPMPDPGSGPGGGFRALEGLDPDLLDSALEACADLRPARGGRTAADLSEADKQALLDVAACLRGQGFDVPDPTFDGRGGFLRPSPGSGFSLRDDEFRDAVQTCRDEAGLDFGRGARQGGQPAQPSDPA